MKLKGEFSGKREMCTPKEEAVLTFGQITGHEAIIEYFKDVIRDHRVAHAYILSGEEGMGKMTLANAFALSLLCERKGEEPCMECVSCRQVRDGNHPDLIYVTHEKPASIGVDDIRRQITDTVLIRPYRSEYKIYIVDEAEKMTPQAQNALLKTLEEPPSYVIILLLTANEEALLPTILSRCVRLKLMPLSDAVIREYLQKDLQVGALQAAVYAAFARGNPGRAISIASSDTFGEFYRSARSLIKRIKTLDVTDILDEIQKMKDEGVDINAFLDLLQMWYRDILICKSTGDTNSLIFQDDQKDIRRISEESSYPGLEAILEAIDKARTRLLANVNTELALELLLLTLKEN